MALAKLEERPNGLEKCSGGVTSEWYFLDSTNIALDIACFIFTLAAMRCVALPWEFSARKQLKIKKKKTKGVVSKKTTQNWSILMNSVARRAQVFISHSCELSLFSCAPPPEEITSHQILWKKIAHSFVSNKYNGQFVVNFICMDFVRSKSQGAEYDVLTICRPMKTESWGIGTID